MTSVLKSQMPAGSLSQPVQDAQAEAIAQRLAQFQETMDLIRSLPNHRAEAGLGPLPDNAVELSYEDCAGIGE